MRGSRRHSPGCSCRRTPREPGKLTPDGDDRLLGGVLGKVDVAQDPVRDGEEAIPNGVGDVSECALVASLRPGPNSWSTAIHLVGDALLLPPLTRYACVGTSSGSIFAISRSAYHETHA
jgi:hypothetical protein